MHRVLWIAAVSLAVLAATAANTAHAANVLDRVIRFTFRMEPAVPKTTGTDSVLDAAKIKAGLRTATPEEQGFVERVVEMARAGEIPPALVESTFQWARKQPFQHRFQYFKRALIVRAGRAGFTI